MHGLHGRPKRGWAPTVLSNPLGCQVVGSQQAGGSLAVGRLGLAGGLDLLQAATGAPISLWYSCACSKLSHATGLRGVERGSKQLSKHCRATAGQPPTQAEGEAGTCRVVAGQWLGVCSAAIGKLPDLEGWSADMAPPTPGGLVAIAWCGEQSHHAQGGAASCSRARRGQPIGSWATQVGKWRHNAGMRAAPSSKRWPRGWLPTRGCSKAWSPSGTRQVPVRAASDWRCCRLVAYSVVS